MSLAVLLRRSREGEAFGCLTVRRTWPFGAGEAPRTLVAKVAEDSLMSQRSTITCRSGLAGIVFGR